MLASKRFLGGILSAFLCLSLPASAQVAAAPTGADVFEALPALSGFRPVPRPDHILRYPVEVQTGATLRPKARMAFLPAAQWDDRREGALWTRAAMSAIRANAPSLATVVPRDIETWCPGYASNPPHLRQAFWVGMMSALAYYESTHRPDAVGGGNRWFGLLQIYPPTARGYACRARTGAALTDAEDNLSCAARILNVTVARDRAVALHDGRWRGVAADWGPMTTASKRNAMAAWTREQSYCQVQSAVARVIRPVARPAGHALTATLSTSNLSPESSR
ncbi:transglycosylase SLT domain-containing protein [Flavimaricola marinus]|uniref:Transglycosylase SLT domain protein n=1 Tax=Flavimaricola marinus TaxID=1819565 RepID=A0A238LFM0_9RHOB|nr:transglycosylase SLT domain-containing protein [Flavimaricola marinus]SMY07746.1 Transglycosylase SLT domain protein [Flavimaricola marinus]